MRVLIVGCGYVGAPLGEALVSEGHEVFGLRRRPDAAPELTAAGIRPLAGDVCDPASLAALPGGFDWVVNTVASSQGGADDYRRVYLEGTRNLIDWLSPSPPKKFVYTSSTGVYGQTDGSAVKESHPTEPLTETGRILVATEQLLFEAARSRGFPAVVLRVAGIYGPDRGHYLKQYLKGEAVIPGRGERFLNMIHLDDLVGAIVVALRSGRPGEAYNVVDNEPIALVHFYRWLSESLGKWMPPFVDETPPAEQRKRGITQKKVQNRRLTMELGYRLKYPTFRQGYTAEIQRLDRAGGLDLPFEPR
jgi:nucleoside-diphosphate-sugar epimerase